ncbi:MAG: hypothetical protein AB7P40_26955 [Chloroflexota bacterium]
MPRTRGARLIANNQTRWFAVQPQSPAVFALCSCSSGARATVSAVERFYTTAELIRERATEGWHASTLTMKEN